MKYLRFNVDLAIPLPLDKNVAEALPGIQLAIRKLKSYAKRINEGKPNEEATVKATYHRCRNEEQLPCEPEQEI